MLEGDKTPILDPAILEEMGYSLAAYPLSLLSSSTKAMQETLQKLKNKETLSTSDDIPPFDELCEAVGFSDYWEQEAKYAD